MKENFKKFIESRIQLIQDNEWNVFFQDAENQFVPYAVRELVVILQTAGIDPIPYLSYIPEGYYMYDNTLKTYITPANVNRINFHAFTASDIEQIVITSNVSVIEEQPFSDCDILTSVIMEEGVKVIGSLAFFGCAELTDVVLPSTLEYLGSNAFNLCPELTTLSYRGTKDEWAKIRNKKDGLAQTYITSVHCKDGVINLTEE